MKKRDLGRLTVSRETLCSLDRRQMARAAGDSGLPGLCNPSIGQCTSVRLLCPQPPPQK